MAERIAISRGQREYVARFLDDPNVVDLFGTDTIPTPFLLTADPDVVVAAVAERNPDALVYFSGSELDEQDQATLDHRIGLYAQRPGPRVGDFVVFADGITRRISYDWQVVDMPGLQTSDSGSFYFGDGYVSFSGGLHPGIDPDVLTDTGETRTGPVWFFHHEHWTAHNGVNTVAPFRVYSASIEANR